MKIHKNEKKNYVKVYKLLLREGVFFAEKNYNLLKHPKVDVHNLNVIKLMQSMKTKFYVTETFSWRHYYW